MPKALLACAVGKQLRASPLFFKVQRNKENFKRYIFVLILWQMCRYTRLLLGALLGNLSQGVPKTKVANIHPLYYFHTLCTHWEPFYFCPGKLVPQGVWERETNTVQWKPWSSTANRENCYNLRSRLRENGPFYRCYPWKGFIPRSVGYFDKLSRKYSCKSPECWPCFTLCATTLASKILQVSLGTCHYLCRGEGGGGGRETLKRGQDYFRLSRGGGGLNVFIKKFRGVCSLIRQLHFTQNDLCATSDKNTNFIIWKK